MTARRHNGRPVQLRIDYDLLLREIRNQHVVAVIETIDVIEFDRLIPVGDRVFIRERLQFQRAGAGANGLCDSPSGWSVRGCGARTTL